MGDIFKITPAEYFLKFSEEEKREFDEKLKDPEFRKKVQRYYQLKRKLEPGESEEKSIFEDLFGKGKKEE